MFMDTAERRGFRFTARVLFVVEDRRAGMSDGRESAFSVRRNYLKTKSRSLFYFLSADSFQYPIL
jgi:hypothetical protein